MDLRRDGWIGVVSHIRYRSVGRAGVGQWVSVNGMSVCVVFGHQCGRRRQGVYLQNIQQSRIPSHGSRVVPLKLWGPEGRVE